MSLSIGTVPKPSTQLVVGQDKAIKMVVQHRCPQLTRFCSMRKSFLFTRESAHFRREDYVMREDEERLSIGAAENELQRTLGNVDLRDLLADRRVDEDLAIGYIDIFVVVDGYTLASTLRERLEICKCAVRVHLGVVGDVFRLAADIDALARLGGEETVGVEVVAEAPP